MSAKQGAKNEARTTESDPSFMLLYYVVKFADITPNFQQIADAMGIVSAAAAQKRFVRLKQLQDSTADGAPSPVKTPATPKTASGKGKKKVAAAERGEDDVEETPTKRRKIAAKGEGKKAAAKSDVKVKENSSEDDNIEDENVKEDGEEAAGDTNEFA